MGRGVEPKMMKDISDANFDEHAVAVKSGSESAEDTSSTSINNININIKSKSSFTNTSREDSHPSPLIAIVNEFLGSYYDDNVLYSSVWEGEDTIARASYEQVSSVSNASSSTTRAPASNTMTLSSFIAQRNERRWERFLHVLWATDYALRPTRIASNSKKRSHSPSYAVSNKKRARVSQQKQTESRFHPVHAWVRCICSPYLGLENAHKYAVWSVLCDMYKRIPEEFREIDDSKSLFQTLAECKATNCKLSVEEIQDIVELIIEADYKSAFIPRQSDGILIGHIAIENGWPCRSLLSKKPSATCA